MKRYCLTLDLVDDPKSMEEYEGWHAPGVGWLKYIKQTWMPASLILKFTVPVTGCS